MKIYPESFEYKPFFNKRNKLNSFSRIHSKSKSEQELNFYKKKNIEFESLEKFKRKDMKSKSLILNQNPNAILKSKSYKEKSNKEIDNIVSFKLSKIIRKKKSKIKNNNEIVRNKII